MAEVLAGNIPVLLERVGWTSSGGSADYLKQRFGLIAADVVKKVEKVIARKQQAKPEAASGLGRSAVR